MARSQKSTKKTNIAKKKTATKTARRTSKHSRKSFVFQSVRGMHDILPKEQIWWEMVRRKGEEIAQYYNFGRIDTPIVEPAGLFEKGVGSATDIVEKQMFFLQSAKDKLVLRPEGTAAVVRAYIEHGLSHLPQPLRLYYIGPMFRHERPQEGRFRQFHQLGFEILGGEDAVYDAQIILVLYRLLESLKVTNINVQLNTIGCRVCRPAYKRRLIEYCKGRDICSDCQRRLAVNPLRFLDCQNKKCKSVKEGAPSILDRLCNVCDAHFKAVLEYLEEINLPYTLSPCLVRGLDYYNRTVFEITADDSGLAVASGGRYDYLVEELGGRPTAAVGGAVGIERLIMEVKKNNPKIVDSLSKKKPKAFLIHVGELAKKKSLAIIEDLRKAGIKAKEALGKESLRGQLKQADKEGVKVSLIIGQREALEDTIIIRDMESGSQETVPISKLIKIIKKRIKS